MKASWPESKFTESERAIREYGDAVFRRGGSTESVRLGCLLKGTRFQIKVWEALLTIPFGALASYQTVADMCGAGDSSRAVAGAIAANPVAYLIPCHRVIRKSGALSDYRWGAARKSAIIGWEAVRMNS